MKLLSIFTSQIRFSTSRSFAVIRYLKDSPPSVAGEPVMVAGDPERNRLAVRTLKGIPFDETTLEEILEAGESVGLSRSSLQTW